MKKTLIILLVAVNILSAYSQKTSSNNTVLTSEVKKQAKAMADAFIKEDYKTFLKFTHPTLIQVMGGENKMITTLTKTINQTKSQGVSFLSITFDNPTKIVKSKNELQCTIVQHLTAKVPSGNHPDCRERITLYLLQCQ